MLLANYPFTARVIRNTLRMHAQARRYHSGVIRSNKEDIAMGIGVSIFLIAVGAILRFAVNVTTNGFDIHMVGNILMIVGVLGALFSLIFWTTWGGWGDRADGGNNVVVERDGPRTRRTTYVERE